MVGSRIEGENTVTPKGLHAATVLLAVLAYTMPAAAQSTRTTAYAQVGKACAPEVRRFCPALDGTAPQPRNQAICLKPYRTSLSLSCRRAVTAAFR